MKGCFDLGIGVPLRRLPRPDWDDDFAECMSFVECSELYDRSGSFMRAARWVKDCLGDAAERKGLAVVLCPQTGELIEYLKSLGCRAYGIAPARERWDFGQAWRTMCSLLAERQKIEVHYLKLKAFCVPPEYRRARIDSGANWMVCRAVDELFHEYTSGTPLDGWWYDEDSLGLKWHFGARLRQMVEGFFEESRSLLKPGGRIVLGFSPAENVDLAQDLFCAMARKVGGYEFRLLNGLTCEWTSTW